MFPADSTLLGLGPAGVIERFVGKRRNRPDMGIFIESARVYQERPDLGA